MSAIRSARRRLVAVGAALAVLVTMFPLAGSAAVVNACPTNLPNSSYRDLGGLTAETVDAIDCITHYGIAQGVSDTRFDPTGDVTRWQMALFITRMADDLGIALAVNPTSRFDDIGTYPVNVQLAINQLAELGVTTGVGVRRFDPAAPVSRWQMALFLTRLHARAGYILPSGTGQGFTDIGQHPANTQMAINQLAQLGIARGTSTTTYTPDALVQRWQMALFLSRQLSAGGALAYRVTLEATPTVSPTNGQVLLVATVRTPAGTPVVGRSVDVFVGSLDAGGRCIVDTDAMLPGGDAATGTDCRIDNADPKTDSQGRVQLLLTHNTVLEVNRVYAWIGDSGQIFDADEVPYYATVDVQWTGVPAALVMPSKVVKFGTTVTVEGWLADSAGTRIVAPDQTIVVKVTRGGSQILSHTLKTGLDGRFVFSYNGPSDPNPNADNPAVEDTVSAFWDKDRDGKDDGAAEFDTTAKVTWDDDLPRNDSAVLSQNTDVTLVGQTVTVRATVTDKFGAAIRDAEVVFVVTGANPGGATVLTNSSGVAAFSYTASSTGIGTIDATVDVDDDGVIDLAAGAIVDLRHLTVVVAPSIGTATTYDVYSVNTAARTVDVFGAGEYYRLRWDTNDTFTVGASNSLSVFESALNALTLPAAGKLTTNSYDANPSGTSTFIVNS